MPKPVAPRTQVRKTVTEMRKHLKAAIAASDRLMKEYPDNDDVRILFDMTWLAAHEHNRNIEAWMDVADIDVSTLRLKVDE
ncbi:hypothetical protein [Mycolicibacterium fortuitum]|uniref:hypothetical protein n=1 Tax=Mycolicibacterium fortuitum TaxID=1766 RepID=UPI001CDBA512|nr:hypothetical protein [Mycolicibacterium fortuitum]UBV14999.1 hypothetical protein H8Z57_30675 [Mycolicibacterium fortuitum]